MNIDNLIGADLMAKTEETKVEPRTWLENIPVYCRYDELTPPQDLKPNPQNPNTHTEKQLGLLGKIIQEQGWRSPITVSKRSGYIVKGHGRLEAAFLINSEMVPVEYQDYDFNGNPPKYVCGMSVPPLMMYGIADQIYKQWFRKERR